MKYGHITWEDNQVCNKYMAKVSYHHSLRKYSLKVEYKHHIFTKIMNVLNSECLKILVSMWTNWNPQKPLVGVGLGKLSGSIFKNWALLSLQSNNIISDRIMYYIHYKKRHKIVCSIPNWKWLNFIKTNKQAVFSKKKY
jgi:hypothetical protein